MAKYHPYARRELRRLFGRWAWESRWRLGVATAGALVLLAFETWLLLVLGANDALRWYLAGCLHAVIVAVLVGAIATSFLVHEHEAILKLRGAWGEDFTRDELERARRKKLIWGSVDSITLQNGDIDHLVVSRSGGLIAIDSKWRSREQDLDPASMASDANKAKLRAAGVVQTLLRIERGSHRAPDKAVRVRPVVVVWGAARKSVPDGARVDGVDFVDGKDLLDWLGRLDGDVIDEAAAADVLAQIEVFRSSAWAAGTRR